MDGKKQERAELHCHSNRGDQNGTHSVQVSLMAAERRHIQAIAFADDRSVLEYLDMQAEQKKTSVKLIYGMEGELEDGTRILVLIQNQKGWESLFSILKETERRTDRRISWKFLEERRANLLIGWSFDEVKRREALWSPEEEAALEGTLRKFDFLELYPASGRIGQGSSCWNTDIQAKQDKRLYELAEKSGIPAVATGNVRYEWPEEAWRSREKRAVAGLSDDVGRDQHFWKTEELKREFLDMIPKGKRGEPCYLSEEQIQKLVVDYSNWIADQIEPMEQALSEEMDLNQVFPDADERLRTIAETGLQEIAAIGDKAEHWIRKAEWRLEQELNQIREQNSSAMWLYVREVMRKARERGIRPMCRGSIGVSLTAYLCGIAEYLPGPRDCLVYPEICFKNMIGGTVEMRFAVATGEEEACYRLAAGIDETHLLPDWRLQAGFHRICVEGERRLAVIKKLEAQTGIDRTDSSLEDPETVAGCKEYLEQQGKDALIIRDFSDVVCGLAFCMGTGTYEDNAEKLLKWGIKQEVLFSDRESLYERLIEYGIAEEEAYMIMEYVRRGKAAWNQNSGKWCGWKIQMETHGMPVWLIDSMEKIHYLPMRADVYQKALELWWEIWFRLHGTRRRN